MSFAKNIRRLDNISKGGSIKESIDITDPKYIIKFHNIMYRNLTDTPITWAVQDETGPF